MFWCIVINDCNIQHLRDFLENIAYICIVIEGFLNLDVIFIRCFSNKEKTLDSEFLSLASFVLVTTFTPGPNNISSASMGILYGYRRTLRYLLGIMSGFFVILMLSGWVSSFLLSKFPSFEGVLRILGALYILWLAWHTLRASYTFEEEDQKPMGFLRGFVLQVLNPKGIIYGLTIYSTFLVDKVDSAFYLILSAVILAVVAFTSVSLWTVFGAGIRKYLGKPGVKRVINIVLALLLVWTAIDLSDILELFE